MWFSVLLSILIGMLAPLGCATEIDEPDEELTSAGQEIQQGVADTEFGAAFPATVYVQTLPIFEGDATACSATLVTPRWVLTAAHCMDDEHQGVDNEDDTWLVRVGPNPSQTSSGLSPDDRVFRHTKLVSGSIPHLDEPSGPFPERDTDLALIRLDSPVPHPIGVPARMPGAGECGPSFAGRLVGFSRKGYDELGYEGHCPDPTSPSGAFRRMGPADIQWYRDHDPSASTFRHNFYAEPFQACTDFAGIGVRGDSGGSLYQRLGAGAEQRPPLQPLLCGVISGDGPDFSGGDRTGEAYSNYATTAVDDPFNLLFLDFFIRDADGFLEDTYEPRRPAVDDPDEDGIARLFDNCPDVYNPEQLTENTDPDGNGAGAACDACPGIERADEPLATNANYEIELANATRLGLVEPTHPDDFPSDAAWEQARQAWAANFRPDGCDPNPVPLQQLRDGGDLPPGAVPGSSTSAACVINGCDPELRNVIRVDVRSSSVIPAGTEASVGLRWCDCRFATGSDTNSVPGRQQCQSHPTANCDYNPGAYGSSSATWRPVETPTCSGSPSFACDAAGNPPPSWASTSVGDEWDVPVGGRFSTFWDFRQLSGSVTTTADSQSVKGILWTTVRHLSPAVSELPISELHTYAATLGTGDASWRFVPRSPRVFRPADDWFFCTSCPMEFQSPLVERGNPDWRVTTEGGSIVYGQPDEATRTHYEEVARGETLHVGTSEPLGMLPRAFRRDDSFVRSVGLKDGAVSRHLMSSGSLDAPPSVFERKIPTATATAALANDALEPSNARGRGFAFSATKQRLYALGGIDEQGQALNEGWMFDLDTGAWRRFPVPEAESVGEVVAAVYRFEDQSIYFLDVEGTRLRLRRWNAQRKLAEGVVQTLATFPAPWMKFGRHSLIAGIRGDLGLVAWDGPARKETRYARLHVDATGHVSMASVHLHGKPLAGVPLLAGDGFYVALLPEPRRRDAPQIPRGGFIPFTAFRAPSHADEPAVHPH